MLSRVVSIVRKELALMARNFLRLSVHARLWPRVKRASMTLVLSFILNRTRQAGLCECLLTAAFLQASDHELLGFCDDAGPMKHVSERGGPSVLYRPDLQLKPSAIFQITAINKPIPTELPRVEHMARICRVLSSFARNKAVFSATKLVPLIAEPDDAAADAQGLKVSLQIFLTNVVTVV